MGFEDMLVSEPNYISEIILYLETEIAHFVGLYRRALFHKF